MMRTVPSALSLTRRSTQLIASALQSAAAPPSQQRCFNSLSVPQQRQRLQQPRLRTSALRLTASRHFATQTVKVPTLGDSISEGTIVSWTKQVGDQVAQDDVVAVIETDKVSVDLRSPYAGKLIKQVAQTEQIVKVGDAIAQIDDAASGSIASQSKSETSSAASKPVAPSQPASAPPAATQPAPTAAVSHSSPSAARPHSPRIHFRYGLRDATGVIAGQAESHHQQPAAPTAAASKPANASDVNTPPSPASFFLSSASERSDWAQANERAALALSQLPLSYRTTFTLSPKDMSFLDFGGCDSYLSPAEAKAKAAADAAKAKDAKGGSGKKAKA